MKKEVCDLMITKFSKKGDVILDPFMGMGTTAVSCYDNERNYIGFEISEEYFKRANNRIEENKAQIRLEIC